MPAQPEFSACLAARPNPVRPGHSSEPPDREPATGTSAILSKNKGCNVQYRQACGYIKIKYSL